MSAVIGGAGATIRKPRPPRRWLRTVTDPKPADSVLNTEAGKGGAPPPCDPLGCRATVGAAEGRGFRRNLVPQAPRSVRRRSAKRRSAIAANPSPATLRASARYRSGIEGAEPLVSPFASRGRTGWAVCRRACWRMSAEHRAGEHEEVLGAKVGAELGQGFEGEHSIPSSTAAGVRTGGVPRQPRGYTGGRRNNLSPNHGKKPRKFNRDCTICHSCRLGQI